MRSWRVRRCASTASGVAAPSGTGPDSDEVARVSVGTGADTDRCGVCKKLADMGAACLPTETTARGAGLACACGGTRCGSSGEAGCEGWKAGLSVPGVDDEERV